MAKILCVEDNSIEAKRLIAALEKEHQVCWVATGQDALREQAKFLPDLAIVDLGLPDFDGHELCVALNSMDRELPFIILSGREGEEARQTSYTLGAHFYLSKPFVKAELLALVARIAKDRSHKGHYGFKHVRLDILVNRLYFDGEYVSVTPHEARLLVELMQNPGVITPKEKLLSLLEVSEKALGFHLANLRKKVKKAGLELRNIYKKGYTLQVVGP